MAKINKSFITSVFANKGLQAAMRKQAQKLIEEKIERSEKVMLDEFENHPVTREIEAGPHSSNTSGTLNGYGNLFSFIGFHSGDENPIYIAKELLKDIRYREIRGNPTKKGATFTYGIDLVKESTVRSLSPLPWETGLSWIHGIEKGISGFGSYMNKHFPYGRSGEGLQAKSPSGQLRVIRGGDFQPTPYFSEFFKAFADSFRSR